MKWISTEDGYKSKCGLATIKRHYEVVSRSNGDTLVRSRVPVGWSFEVQMTGNKYTGGRRLLKDAKARAEYYLTKEHS